MHYIALKMLTGDRAKYLGLIFAIAFSTFLLENQASIFAGIILRTASQIVDVVEADLWVMDPKTRYVEEVEPLRQIDLQRVRGVPGVAWATPLFRGLARAKTPAGEFRVGILLGVDDATLVGVPRKLLQGRLEDLWRPDALVIDRAGFLELFPGEPLQLGKTVEMNDRRLEIVAIVEASAPFQTFPVFITRYSEALQLVGAERNQLSFVLAKVAGGARPGAIAERIQSNLGLAAQTTRGFAWQTMNYYLKNTGIPVNFGITIAIAVIVGAVVAGQTFYLFTLENLKQFGALKAIGVSDRRLVGMILLQAFTVAAIGYALGSGLAAGFFLITLQGLPTRGIILQWQFVAGTGAVIFFVIVLASLLSIRRVLVLEPAAVFRG